jgi:hypothetical protein
MAPEVEVRGVVYLMLREVFPHLGEMFDPELGALFEEVEAEGWYGAELYVRARGFLKEHMSPAVSALVGTRLIDLFQERLHDLEVDTPRDLAERINEVYAEYVRGPGAGEWTLEEYRGGRAVLSYDGDFAGPALCIGIMNRALELTGACDVRIGVIEERAQGAAVDRYLLEWMEP